MSSMGPPVPGMPLGFQLAASCQLEVPAPPSQKYVVAARARAVIAASDAATASASFRQDFLETENARAVRARFRNFSLVLTAPPSTMAWTTQVRAERRRKRPLDVIPAADFASESTVFWDVGGIWRGNYERDTRRSAG